jgi:hypothetical protein
MLNNTANTMKKMCFGTLINCAAIWLAEGIYEYYLRLIVSQDRSFEFLADFWFYTYIIVEVCFLLMRRWEAAIGALLSIFVVFYFIIPLVMGMSIHPFFVSVIITACFLLMGERKIAVAFLSIVVVLFHIIPFLFDLGG